MNCTIYQTPQTGDWNQLERSPSLCEELGESDFFADRVHKILKIKLDTRSQINPISISYTSRKRIYKVFDSQTLLFIKERPKYMAADAIFLAEEIQCRLSNVNSNVPPIISSWDGRMHWQIWGKTFFAMPYISGRAFSGGHLQTRHAGEALAKLHLDSRKIDLPNQHSVPMITNVQKLISFLRENKKITNLIETIEQILETLNPEAEPHGCVHGDFAPFNIIFEDENVIAITDFDNAYIGSQIYDVATGALTFSSINYLGASSTLHPSICTQPDKSRLNDFLIGYYSLNQDSLRLMRANFSDAFTLCWIELLLLGLLRGDFVTDEVWRALQFIQIFKSESATIIDSIIEKDFAS